MIDALAIFLSCLALAIVITRAIKLDAVLPWFTPLGGTKPTETTVDGKVARKAAPKQGMLSNPSNKR